MRMAPEVSSNRPRIVAGTVVAGLLVLGIALVGGSRFVSASASTPPPSGNLAGSVRLTASTDTTSPAPTGMPSPSPTDTPSPAPTGMPGPVPTDGLTICETGEDLTPCLGTEPTVCPAGAVNPSPSPTLASAGTLATYSVRLDPPKPCTVKVTQVVAVSELFQADTKPKVGDTLDIQLNLAVPSKAQNAAQAAIKMVTDKGKTPITVTIRATVYMVDDLGGALVVYAQVDAVNISAKGYALSVGYSNGEKFALPVVLK
jgi:hypothetical protein